MNGIWIPIIGCVCALGILPALVFSFVYKLRKLKVEEKDIAARSEELKLEIELERLRLARKTYDPDALE